MEFLGRLDAAARRVWIILSLRLGIRKRGLMKLRHEIRACEYEDVRVMWELIRRKEEDGVVGGYTKLTKFRRRMWSAFGWATQGPRRLCSSF